MSVKPTRFCVLIAMLVFSTALFAGCMQSGGAEKASELPEIPQKLSINSDGIPELKVYDTKEKTVENMDIESYLMGVVAGEMKNDWPIEALKAQAILARTFTLKFVSDKNSSYSGADISTDVKEAQAYNAVDVNDRVRQAVNETRGMVMSADGELPYAWFHAHAAGMTELPSKALEYKQDPAYLEPVSSPESENAPENVKNWTAEFSLDQVRKACSDVGTDTGAVESVEIGERGESGRAIYLLINGKRISAPAFRLQIGADKLKSTMIDEIELNSNAVRFSGRGFGHGVGMSQWGAYGMAESGKSAQDIIEHYFTGVELVELW